DKSRVDWLDVAMGFTNAGTPSGGILGGKLQYINGNNPTGKPLAVTVSSQGRFCPANSAEGPNCPFGVNGDAGKTPTVDFITKAIADKKDVEVCFAWPAKPGAMNPKPGAHCVFAVGYRFVYGFLSLDVTHDFSQGNDGGIFWDDGGHMSMRIGMF